MGVKQSRSTPASRHSQPCSTSGSMYNPSPVATILVSAPKVNVNLPLATKVVWEW